MVNQRDREVSAYNEGYADARRAGSGGSLLGIFLGVVVVLGLGAGAYFLLAGQSPTSEDSPDIINVPAQEAPQAPDVNVDVPSPEINIEAPSSESPSGSTESSGSSTESP
ncbi:hypothetical protein [Lyngbya confervoides]|uniref:Uncharacterized protein n=1 Tax=Lyngbya confervoides BDU141951 TaxID=1574623 RepID=A0ABD4T822_9CYAN|nr:hypothetical protein [Lyngbya confervoides]MCM1984623.1 hypothetical protein [Lyngbya confervoides BDU141951]